MNVFNTMNRIKKYVKILLSRHKIRKFLFLVQVPVSFIVIYFSRLFDGSWYRIQLNVVDEERVGSLLSSHLLHYIIIGRRKGYTPSPLFIPLSHLKLYKKTPRFIKIESGSSFVFGFR